MKGSTFDIFNLQAGEAGNASSNAAVFNRYSSGFFAIDNFSGGKDLKVSLKRKYFPKQHMQVVDGFYMTEDIASAERSVTTASVEQYLIIESDTQIPPTQACKGAEIFNKESYYINLDFDCENISMSPENIYLDIYGEVTDSEICPD